MGRRTGLGPNEARRPSSGTCVSKTSTCLRQSLLKCHVLARMVARDLVG